MDLKLPRLPDVLVAAAMLVLAVVTAVSLGDPSPNAVHEYDALGYLLITLQVLPLAFRQRYPRAVLWVSMLFWVVAAGLGYVDTPAMLAIYIALYGVASYMPPRQALVHIGAATGVLFGWITVGLLATDYVSAWSYVAGVLAVLVPVGLGFTDYRRRERMTELELDAQRREQAERIAAADAVRAERARIARELHDVVAHEMTVMTLQAEGARRRAAKDDPVLAEALATISDSGRKGLAEMQRMIGVLRTSEREAEDEAAELTGRVRRSGTIGAVLGDDLGPMPSLAAIPELVQQVEDAGMPVTLTISGTSHVPAGVELSAYRIVQESLTNALKYAGPGAHAIVTLTRRPEAVTIEVQDDGRGTISEVAGTSGGHGLAGMRERVVQLGGELELGPRKGGGFRVHAVLPVTDDQVRAGVARTTSKGDS
ncbi:sensor histidine kinase [Demequina zhanjiangensis]|uniref:histidine kinase n=1 Tax=Demequina zhanjiangensis TaxID=3051659 RepID=A0ABT8FX45_9MICO|nr:sensor histidine kinase [Demequina sp. SYSU T00b26]MDN4471465.1 sensor histidine kinase [Demequina sp. SYSU T00b26]